MAWGAAWSMKKWGMGRQERGAGCGMRRCTWHEVAAAYGEVAYEEVWHEVWDGEVHGRGGGACEGVAYGELDAWSGHPIKGRWDMRYVAWEGVTFVPIRVATAVAAWCYTCWQRKT